MGMLEAEADIKTATEKNVLRVLRQVNDPEAGVNIIDLQLIYGTDIPAGWVRIAMTMTTPACRMHFYLPRVVLRDELEDLDGVEVQLVAAAWSPAMTPEAGERQLGWR
jgi:metal-sulfur cluster biosynthetic enzyme